MIELIIVLRRNKFNGGFESGMGRGIMMSELMQRINRVLCESTFDNEFATLILAMGA